MDMVWIWHGTARHGTARHGTARHGTAWHGMVATDVSGMVATDVSDLNRRHTNDNEYSYEPAVARFFHLKICSGFQSHGKWPGAETDRRLGGCSPGDI